MALPYRTALIVGAGPGVSAAVARALAAEGIAVALAARNVDKLQALAASIGAHTYPADATDPQAIAALFAQVAARSGEPDIVLYNASARERGPLTDLDPARVAQALAVTALGGFYVVQQAARTMLPHRRGAILLTGATASLRAYAQSAPFAMGKFALRALAQSAARELGPRGIHVAHIILDGVVRRADRPEPPDQPDSLLDPDAIAQSYLDVLRQPRSAWSNEIELRPWCERF